MTIVNELRRSVIDTTPVYVVVGVTDLAVEKVRAARSQAERARAFAVAAIDLDPRHLQARAQRVPTVAVTMTLEAAGRAEETYDELAARGRRLVERIRAQPATADLLAQGKVTLSRGRAAATMVRRVGVDTRSAAKATVTTAEREGREVGEDVRASVRRRTTATTSSAKRTATTATKRTARTTSTAKAATTSARATAAAASKAAKASAATTGG